MVVLFSIYIVLVASNDTQTYLLPVKLTSDTLPALVAQVLRGAGQQSRHIQLDFTRLEGLQVGGVTVLCNLIELVSRLGFKVTLYAAEWCPAAEFVQRSGLLAFGNKALRVPKKCPSFLPIKLVEYQRSHNYVHSELIPWMAENLGHETRALGSLGVCFEELFNNIRDHSTIDVGCSAGHFNVATGKITMCVSDFGVGIPGKVRVKVATPTDHAAIALACRQGFTTQSTPKNMGAGLHVLVQNVVELHSGKVQITSGEGIYTCVPSGELSGSKRSGRTARTMYPGTMIRMQLDIRDFVPDEVGEEEFVWEL
jgi:ABC-type transporter Mla MlaB component